MPSSHNTDLAIGALLLLTAGVLAALMLRPSLLALPGKVVHPTCANNLKQMGIVFKMYANENDGQYPPPMWEAGRNGVQHNLSVDAAFLYPDYLNRLSTLDCPDGASIRGAGGNLLYLPWDMSKQSLAALESDEDWQQFEDALAKRLSDGRVEEAIKFSTQAGVGVELHRVAEHIERRCLDVDPPIPAGSIEALIPLLIDCPLTANGALVSPHSDGKFRVLFLDGHVESISLEDAAGIWRKLLQAVLGADAAAKRASGR